VAQAAGAGGRAVHGEEDLVDRAAFQGVAFEAQYRVRLGGSKPDQVVPGWDEHFVALVRENSRANNERENSATVLHRIEQKRALYAAAAAPAPPPTGYAAPAAAPDIRPPTAAAASVDRYTRRTVSKVLTEFLDAREQQDGDRRADSDIEPMVRFLIELLGDPVMLDFNGDHLLKVKKALPAITTPRGFAPSAAARSSFAVKSSRMTLTAPPIDAAPLSRASIESELPRFGNPKMSQKPRPLV
jgi:hypothetical protein